MGSMENETSLTWRAGRAASAVRLLGGLALLEASLVLLGWALDVPALRGAFPGFVPMNPTTAIALGLEGVALALLAGGMAPRAGRGCAALAVALAGAKLLSFAGLDLGVDRLLFSPLLDQSTPPNRMAPNTTVQLILAGTAILLLGASDRRRWWARGLALLNGGVAAVALVGYAYGAQPLYGLSTFIPTAVVTVAGVLLLSVATLLVAPDDGLLAPVLGSSPGGLLLRRLLPAAVGLPLVLGALVAKGGSQRWFDEGLGIALAAVLMAAGGALLLWWTATSLDGLEASRRAAAAERRQRLREVEREQRLRGAVLDASSDAVVLLSAAQQVLSANQRVEDFFGISAADLAHSRGDELCALARRAFGETAWPRGAAPARFDLVQTWPAQRELEVSVTPVEAEPGEPVSTLYTFRDVTRERDAERTKDELISVVSHELRTPLASIVGFAELLLARDFPEASRREFLSVTLQEGRRLTALINDFLDLQRMESGRQQIQAVPTSLATLVADAVRSVGDDPEHPFVLDVPDDLPLVNADGERIQQVLLNLISNARRYSPAPGQIILRAMEVDNGEMVEMAVQDHGLGLPPDAVPRLFQKFYRVDNSDRRAIKGTGLGLAVSRHIVDAHGGRIWAESEGLGQGTTFRFTLPVAAADTPGGQVLIVEDDAGFARLLAAELAERGHASERVGSAEAALQRVARGPVKLVVLDLRLPGLHGDAFLAQLRQTGFSAPVVVVSVQDLEPAEREALRALGVVGILRKGPSVASAAARLVAETLMERAEPSRAA